MKEQIVIWRPIELYTHEELCNLLVDSQQVIVWIKDQGTYFAEFYPETGFCVWSLDGEEFENPPITHWTFDLTAPY